MSLIFVNRGTAIKATFNKLWQVKSSDLVQNIFMSYGFKLVHTPCYITSKRLLNHIKDGLMGYSQMGGGGKKL